MLIFEGFGTDPSRHFYLLFLPLIWIAVRFGMNGAIVATAVVQLGVVLVIHGETGIPLPIVELQALMAALTLTGLFLGVMVDERQRAEEHGNGRALTGHGAAPILVPRLRKQPPSSSDSPP